MGEAGPEDKAEYWRHRAWLEYVMHELPAGVLHGADGASEQECREMMQDLDAFAELCRRLGVADHEGFIDSCRWHLDHYPHYLGRRRHFDGYASYVTARGGPLRVEGAAYPGFPRPPEASRAR